MLDRSSAFSAEDPTDNRKLNTAGSGFISRIVKRVSKLGGLFIVTVLLPTLCATIYFSLFASDIYISEAKFVVRSPEKSASSSLGFFLKSAGFANASDEVYAAQDFVQSRDALKILNRGEDFERTYKNPSISYFDRFGSLLSGSSFEDLYRYYKKKVQIRYDAASSIVTLTVRAYEPKDAQRFNERLIEMAEATVNQLNNRGRQDLIHFAQAEVDEAQERARKTALALSAYRNRQGVVDPERQATIQLQMIAKLQDELIATKNQLTQVRAFAPENPQIEVIEVRMRSLSRQIDEEIGKVAGNQGSLSSAAARYQRLILDDQFSEKQLASAMVSLEDARNEARRKQVYVERIVQPNQPDDPLEPKRIKGILATLALGVVAWGVLSMLLAGVMEHRA